MIRNIKIEGWKEIEKKLGYDALMHPSVERAKNTVVDRMMRGGKGQGVKNNVLTKKLHPAGAEVYSTLNWPRTKGAKWGQYQEKVVKGIVARKAFTKAAREIEAEWGS